MQRKEKGKLALTFVCFLGLGAVVIAKAFYVQVVNNARLVKYSKGQILRETEVYPYRGNIYDRSGSPLAINVKTYSIFTIPKNVEGRDRTWREVARIVPELKYKEIREKTFKRQKYTWLARKIQLKDEQVEKLKRIKGIYFEAVPKRFYPNHELLSQSLGFVGIDNTGLSGIEFLFDKELRGRPIQLKYFQDAKGRAVKFESEELASEAHDLYLSIDKELQAMAERALKEGVIENSAEKGGIGVMDADTGEILAIANYPTFDANILEGSRPEHRKLSFVSDPFEPGSTFKLLTVASALEHKIARPDTNYYCEQGKMLVEDHWITEAEAHEKFEWLSVTDIVKHSSNVGTTKIAFDLTFPKLQKTLIDFNIGEKTGIEIPGESRGIFVGKQNVSSLSLSNISFGQGVATTGIQMLSAYSAIANGGYYVKPTILKKGKNDIKKTRIISEETALQLQKMLVKVVEDGTGTNAKIEHFVIAGKTSTAQKHDKNGGYKGHIPGFIGFPLNVPRKVVIYVYIDNPQGVQYYGNFVAAPIFKKVAQYILYRDRELSSTERPNLKKKDSSKKLILARSNSDSVSAQIAASRQVAKENVPNFIGLDRLSALALLKSIGVKGEHKGIGVVIDQGPKAGAPILKDTVVKLIYSPPKYE